LALDETTLDKNTLDKNTLDQTMLDEKRSTILGPRHQYRVEMVKFFIVIMQLLVGFVYDTSAFKETI
jgi:chaperonin GroEL (HSP60 family)